MADDSGDSDLAPQSPGRVSATWAPPSVPIPRAAAAISAAGEDAASQVRVDGLLPSESFVGASLFSDSSVNQLEREASPSVNQSDSDQVPVGPNPDQVPVGPNPYQEVLVAPQDSSLADPNPPIQAIVPPNTPLEDYTAYFPKDTPENVIFKFMEDRFRLPKGRPPLALSATLPEPDQLEPEVMMVLLHQHLRYEIVGFCVLELRCFATCVMKLLVFMVLLVYMDLNSFASSSSLFCFASCSSLFDTAVWLWFWMLDAWSNAASAV